jgi:mRNA-degrading endonuclease RelE of RelBE toxin-antitoxin system
MAIVLLTPAAQQQADALPRAVRARIDGLLLRLERWPDVSGAKPLRGELANRWRMRTGDYRVQFRVEGGTVVVEKVGHRDGFYD